jgi:hypothetical protein
MLRDEVANQVDVVSPDRVDQLAGERQAWPIRGLVGPGESELGIGQPGSVGLWGVWMEQPEFGQGDGISGANGAEGPWPGASADRGRGEQAGDERT